jgi:hypothetical protein
MNGMGTQYELITLWDSRALYELCVGLSFEFQHGTDDVKATNSPSCRSSGTRIKHLPTAVQKTLCPAGG